MYKMGNSKDDYSVPKLHKHQSWLRDGNIMYLTGHEINFFGKEPSGSYVFQSGRQG